MSVFPLAVLAVSVRQLLGLVLGGQRLLGAPDPAIEVAQRALGPWHGRPLAIVGLQDGERRIVPARPHQRVEMDGAEQRALGDAAADLLQVRHGLAQKTRGLGVIALGIGGKAVCGRHGAVGPGFAVGGPRVFGALFQARQHFGDGALLAGAGEAVEILQVEEGHEVLVQARPEIVRHVGPAAADIDAAQFEARQQRDGVDLVLGEFLPHAPHARVEQGKRLVGAVEIDQEEGEVPPVVGVHEGVAADPGVGHRFQEGHALQHLAARFQAMGDRVVRPRIAAIQGERLARHGLGLVEAIALLQAERIHRVDVAVVAIGLEQMLADAQQRLRSRRD